MYWITGILGLALIAAPYFLGYTGDTVAYWTSMIIGVVVVGISAIEGFFKDRDLWEYWVAGILGLGAIVAPFILGFGSNANAMWTIVITGILLAFFAGSKLYSGRMNSS